MSKIEIIPASWPGLDKVIAYFTSDEQPTVFELKGKKIGINICEDIWHKSAAMKAKESGAEIIIVINGSPMLLINFLFRAPSF